MPRKVRQVHDRGEGDILTEPGVVQKIGQTTVIIYAPEQCSDEELASRRDAIIRAVAKCISND